MTQPLPDLLWETRECHRQLLSALDDAFDALSARDGFGDDWRSWRTVPDTKTSVRQTPMLGNGASGRDRGGFHLFARRYVDAEGSDVGSLNDRCSFERYQDFAFYSLGDWYAGKKVPLLVAECETNPKELLGELSGLITVRCPLKYLFIHGADTLARLNGFCSDPHSQAVDWPGTTYYVIEIPDSPLRPSSWRAFEADVEKAGGAIRFAPAA